MKVLAIEALSSCTYVSYKDNEQVKMISVAEDEMFPSYLWYRGEGNIIGLRAKNEFLDNNACCFVGFMEFLGCNGDFESIDVPYEFFCNKNSPPEVHYLVNGKSMVKSVFDIIGDYLHEVYKKLSCHIMDSQVLLIIPGYLTPADITTLCEQRKRFSDSTSYPIFVDCSICVASLYKNLHSELEESKLLIADLSDSYFGLSAVYLESKGTQVEKSYCVYYKKISYRTIINAVEDYIKKVFLEKTSQDLNVICTEDMKRWFKQRLRRVTDHLLDSLSRNETFQIDYSKITKTSLVVEISKEDIKRVIEPVIRNVNVIIENVWSQQPNIVKKAKTVVCGVGFQYGIIESMLSPCFRYQAYKSTIKAEEACCLGACYVDYHTYQYQYKQDHLFGSYDNKDISTSNSMNRTPPLLASPIEQLPRLKHDQKDNHSVKEINADYPSSDVVSNETGRTRTNSQSPMYPLTDDTSSIHSASTVTSDCMLYASEAAEMNSIGHIRSGHANTNRVTAEVIPQIVYPHVEDDSCVFSGSDEEMKQGLTNSISKSNEVLQHQKDFKCVSIDSSQYDDIDKVLFTKDLLQKKSSYSSIKKTEEREKPNLPIRLSITAQGMPNSGETRTKGSNKGLHPDKFPNDSTNSSQNRHFTEARDSNQHRLPSAQSVNQPHSAQSVNQLHSAQSAYQPQIQSTYQPQIQSTYQPRPAQSAYQPQIQSTYQPRPAQSAYQPQIQSTYQPRSSQSIVRPPPAPNRASYRDALSTDTALNRSTATDEHGEHNSPHCYTSAQFYALRDTSSISSLTIDDYNQPITYCMNMEHFRKLLDYSNLRRLIVSNCTTERTLIIAESMSLSLEHLSLIKLSFNNLIFSDYSCPNITELRIKDNEYLKSIVFGHYSFNKCQSFCYIGPLENLEMKSHSLAAAHIVSIDDSDISKWVIGESACANVQSLSIKSCYLLSSFICKENAFASTSIVRIEDVGKPSIVEIGNTNFKNLDVFNSRISSLYVNSVEIPSYYKQYFLRQEIDNQ